MAVLLKNGPFDQRLRVFGQTRHNLRHKHQPAQQLSKLDVLYFNARSLNNKIAELHALLSLHEHDVILITETWLKSYHKDAFLCSNSKYFIIRSDRHDQERGGGVCAFIKTELSKQVNIITTISEEKEFDIAVFDLHLQRDKTLRFVCAYLPPDSSKDKEIVAKMVNILNKIFVYNATYIFGDFNFSKVVWKNGKALCSPSKEFDRFHNLLLSKNLIQLINGSTHSSGNTLDLLVAPQVNNVTVIDVQEPFNINCDHNMIQVLLTVQKQQVSSQLEKKNFYKGDYCAINNFLRTVDWTRLLTEDDVESNYQNFINVLHDCIDCFVPSSSTRKKAFVPKHLKALRIQKRQLYRLSKTNSDAKEEYRKVEKIYKKQAHQYYASLEE